MFPAVDPIPIPAPIWLMKFLSLVTLALHFSAVMILVGCLLLVIWLNYRGISKRNDDAASAAFVIARRLPVLMTFVINLGVPPLLFAQVMYGRAIYSSSVLIGALWFSVLLQLMLAYWLLYRIVAAIEAKKAAWPLAVLTLLIVMGVGQIYSMNMTLMLHPEAWQQMYANSPSGLQGYHGDPTATPRWLFVMSGGLVFGGLWALMLSNMKHIGEGVKATLRKSGGYLAAVGCLVQLFCAYLVFHGQPDAVKVGLASPFYLVSGLVFVATTAVAGLLAFGQAARVASNVLLGATGVVVAFLANAGAAIFRDGIRDLTLQQHGFNVWQRTENSNWSVIVIFLLLFVSMLGIIYWLLSVMRQATVPNEQVTA